MAEDIHGRHRVLFQTVQQHNRLNGISAQRKEVVPAAHRTDSQYLLEPSAYRALALRLRFFVVLSEIRYIRRLKGQTVQLAVLIQRELLHPDEEFRNHVIGKRLRQPPPYLFLRPFFLRPLFHLKIAAQKGLAVLILKSFDNRRFHKGSPAHLRFNLAGFHTLAVNLNHPVPAV